MRQSGGASAWVAALALALRTLGCSGSSLTTPLEATRAPAEVRPFEPPAPTPTEVYPRVTRRIGAPTRQRGDAQASEWAEPPRGRHVGIFRNTYYDFPAERDYRGSSVPLFDTRCRELARVPRGFHDTVCVQGSGLLSNGRTVSFARRHCSCAELCPRTHQQICFDALDAKRYPFGRGATGQAVVPLLTVAVDTAVIPLGTSLFIPEYVGVPRGLREPSGHDGCFIAQDRGIKVRGQHVDIFTGEESLTRLWNELVPSNLGVTIILDSPACVRAD